MTSNTNRSPSDPKAVVENETRPGMGMLVAAVLLVLVVIAAIWYFQATGNEDQGSPGVTITIDPNADPGTETTIVP